MGKITICILTFFLFFSIANVTKASNIAIENILDLNFGFEDRQLNLKEIESYDFRSQEKNQMLNQFKRSDRLLRQEVTRLYRNEQIKSHEMNGIISKYNKFIYYINRYFFYEYLKERADYSELSIASDRNFKYARTFFEQTKSLIKKTRK